MPDVEKPGAETPSGFTKEATERVRKISAVSAATMDLTKKSLKAGKTKAPKPIIVKEKYAEAREVAQVLNRVDRAIKGLAKITTNLAEGAKNVAFETARGVRNITTILFQRLIDTCVLFASHTLSTDDGSVSSYTLHRIEALIKFVLFKSVLNS